MRHEQNEAWGDRVVVDPSVLGGEPVFRGTRLSVRKIGAMLARGLLQEVREDYPYLSDEDLRIARTFADGP